MFKLDYPKKLHDEDAIPEVGAQLSSSLDIDKQLPIEYGSASPLQLS
jgi:hypothetical protein